MAQLKVDKDLIKELAQLLEETELSEIEVGEGDQRIRVARNLNGAVVASPLTSAAINETYEPTAASSTPVVAPGSVTSPMVGTVYSAPEPGAPDFVKVGDQVNEGQTLIIIEAMKIMNAIEAPHAGTVTEIIVADGQPVEYGEPLLVIQ